ncbi:hypothetical protein D9613_010928 [Agrocybe pediades]|uniref:Uncharacterized protein n=1 Tax=Agrocybe pediades TaxID=84607 RepID=A0A8H4VJ77_9AGAR|nr:hypothetical protein D9613_010928 [Agrocybe pediades]KAF9554999.1 hypothetical protein CPC08DRAFT_643517 [Agrocybe pediades]
MSESSTSRAHNQSSLVQSEPPQQAEATEATGADAVVPSASTGSASPRVAFISGPIEMPEGYFAEHYVPMIDRAIAAGDDFVIGPVAGTDTLALQYLVEKGVEPDRITVYLTEFEKRYYGKSYAWLVEAGGEVHEEGVTTGERDAAMTRDSDYDILRYMSVEEQKVFYGERYFPRVSNTERNERRRKGLPLHPK